jgi:hypothetical protein
MDQRGLFTAACFDVPIDRVVARVEFAIDEPSARR